MSTSSNEKRTTQKPVLAVHKCWVVTALRVDATVQLSACRHNCTVYAPHDVSAVQRFNVQRVRACVLLVCAPEQYDLASKGDAV